MQAREPRRRGLARLAPVLALLLAWPLWAQELPAASSPLPLRFADFFRSPTGAKGMELTDTLQQADGRTVRLTGYMVQQELPTPGRFMLTPRPVRMSEHADGDADDLPAAWVMVYLDASQQDFAIAYQRGLLQVSGVLSVGRLEEQDGRVSWVRLQLDIVTADHECSGAALIGGSRVTDARLQELVREGGASKLRDQVVGIYEQAGFPKYKQAADGYPETTDIDYRLLVGYGAGSDRYEDFRTNDRPLQDSQQPFVKKEPLAVYPAGPMARDAEGKYLVTGQVPGDSAVHTATDIPLSAFGPGAWSFTGVQDNTDVFFKLAQAANGVVLPADIFAVKRTLKK